MKKIEYRFKKLFHRVKEGESVEDSIIAYAKYPFEFKSVACGNNRVKTITTKWKCSLYLNLYFVRIKFRWIKNEKRKEK